MEGEEKEEGKEEEKEERKKSRQALGLFLLSTLKDAPPLQSPPKDK